MPRIIAPALIALAILFGVSFSLSYGLLALADTSSACAELAMLLCGIILIPFAVVMGVVIEIAAVQRFLKKQSVPHPVAVPVLATVGLFTSCYAIVRLFEDSLPFYVVAGLLFVANFVLFDWYVNKLPGKFDSKILRSAAGFGVIAIIATLLSLFMLR